MNPLPEKQAAEVLQAIKSDDRDRLKQLLDGGLPVSAEVPLHPAAPAGLTLLEHACMSGSHKVTELLLQSKASPAKGKFKPLILAIKANHLEIVKLLLSAGADPNIKVSDFDSVGHRERALTPLMFAAAANIDPEILALLLDAGADPHAATNKGNTALSRSLAYGNIAAAARLLKAGCKPDGPILSKPVQNGELDLVRTLIAAGADVNAAGEPTLLEAAVRSRAGYVKQLRNLLPSEEHAVERCKARAEIYFEIIQALLPAGAEPNPKPTSESPLYSAAAAGDLEVVKMLLEAQADPNVAFEAAVHYNEMALHAACCGGFAEVVKALLDAGADTGAKNYRGKTPLETLRERTRSTEIEVWEKFAANLDDQSVKALLQEKYEVWNQNRAAIIQLLERSHPSAPQA